MVFKAEIINIITEILQSLQICPESSIRSLIPLLPAYRITLRAIKNPGKELPKKELQWCEKLRTIAPPEESIPLENHSTANVATECDAFTTPVNPITEDLSTADITSREDASATRGTSTAQDSSTVDATSEDATSEDATSEGATSEGAASEGAASEGAASEGAASEGAIPEGATPTVQDTSTTRDQRARNNIAKSLTDYEVIKKFKEKAPVFETWTSEPRKFWTPPAIQELQLPESTINERYKVYYEDVAEQKPNIEALNLIHRFDSVIAYFRFKQWFPLVRDIRFSDVETFVETIGILKVHAHKYYSLILSGRRRVQFCHFLSKGIVDTNTFRNFCHDDVNFHDIDYGVLFIEVDDRIWDTKESRFFKSMKFFVEELQSRNITEISKKSGAELAAKALLHSRQAFLGNRKLPASSDAEENSSTVESRSAPPNDGENDVTAATTDKEESNITVATSDEVESNTTAATSNDEGSDTTVATSDDEGSDTTVATSDDEGSDTTVATSDDEGSDTTVATSDDEGSDTTVATSDNEGSDITVTSKRSRTEADLDCTRAPKRSRTDLDNTLTSDKGGLHILAQAVEVAGQNATASESTVANLVSDLHTMQLNNARPSNSETGYKALNSVDIQGRDPEDINGIASEVSSRDEKLPLPDTNTPQLHYSNHGLNTIDPALLNGNTLRTGFHFDDGNPISFDTSSHTNTPNLPLNEQQFALAASWPNDGTLLTGIHYDDGNPIPFDTSSHTNTPNLPLNEQQFAPAASWPNDGTLLTGIHYDDGNPVAFDTSSHTDAPKFLFSDQELDKIADDIAASWQMPTHS